MTSKGLSPKKPTVKSPVAGDVNVEDAGVIITLPSGHKETVTTDQADDILEALRVLLEDPGI